MIALVVTAALFTTVVLVRVRATREYQPYWARYNYTGYEGGEAPISPRSPIQYKAFIDTAAAAPARSDVLGGAARRSAPTARRSRSCSSRTGPTVRIPSMEGLYYEAAGTTGFHFLAAATLDRAVQTPCGLPYRSFTDFDLGVRYLQLLGVRYCAATSGRARAAAAANPALREVATVPDLDVAPPNGWTIYEVRGTPASCPARVPSSPKICTKRPTGSARGAEAPEGTPGIAEFLLGSAGSPVVRR